MAVRRTIVGCAASLGALAASTAVLVALRPHLAVATCALVLVVPVVIGVAVGGFVAGLIGATAGFLVFDWYFIPPYGTLTVGSAQDWVALWVYVAVVLVVARVVAVQQEARAVAAEREDAVRRLLAVTTTLMEERPLDEVLGLVVTTVHEAFDTPWVAVLLPEDGALAVAATAGDPLSDAERAEAIGAPGAAQAMALVGEASGVRRIALTAMQRPVGQLVVAGAPIDAFGRQLLGVLANQAALAIERSQLRAQALRSELLEEVDRWRSALVGAVSHDLRTPLASITAAVTTLRDPGVALSDADRDALMETIELESDRLARLVANLLDVGRIEAGTLTLRREPHTVTEVVDAARAAAGSALRAHRLVVEVDDDLPLVSVDLVLIAQVVANLLANAAQHSPEGTRITVGAREEGDAVAVFVADEGSGVRTEDREQIFHMLDRNAGSGRAGLGLAISTAFVEAHGQHLWVDDAPRGGARFTFRVPLADLHAVPA